MKVEEFVEDTDRAEIFVRIQKKSER